MNPKHSLRARLLLVFTGLIVLGFAALTAFASNQLSANTIADYEKRLMEQAALIARGLHDPVEHTHKGELSQTELEAAVAQYAQQFGIRVTLLDNNGRFWLGAADLNSMESTTAPEIAAALNGQVIHNTRRGAEGQFIVYTAAPVYDDGYIIGAVHLAAPLSEAQALVQQRWSVLVGGVILLAIVAIGVSLWLSASLIRPLTQLRLSALQIAEGNFSQRLPETRQDEIGQLAGAFNHMAAQVDAMLEEQRAFAGNASHELRTPLTAIRLRSEALRDGLVDAETARQYIIEIDDEVSRLSNLTQDLTLLSRLDSGNLQPGQESVNMLRLAQRLVDECQPQAAEKQLSITLNAPAILPEVQASLSHLHIVFRNVLNNAIKYTPPGGSVSWQITPTDTGLLNVIIDTGQGIAAEDIGHLFERFYRADKAHSREVAGVGLGLSLVKMIVDFYGGEIVVKSAGIGQGTAVTITWPIALQ